MIIHDVVQGSPEWFALRAGKMTASHAQEIGNAGKGLETYIYKTLAAKHSLAEQEQFSNEHTQRGVELEDQARAMYELKSNTVVENVGFVEYDSYSGCSPDGLVSNDGGIEIKCHDDVKHFRLLVNGVKEIDSKYLWQMQMNMLITQRVWWDYVAYNPNFEESIIIHRIEADIEKHQAIANGIIKGTELIKSIEEKLYGKQ